ncbi:MAG TPA: DUF2341 domain-containing protein, partial [Methanomicrobiales archaeon]|nr:DUF2341 domain-containing protein [Methanomicrobiales archaeon]
MDVRDRAVSEIIGTLVLVGIVVIGIVLAAILLFSNPAASRVPIFDAIISNQSNTIYIYHKGGDSLIAGEYRILVDGVDRTSSFVNNGDEPWSVGETLSYTSPTMPGHVVIVFTGVGQGGGSVIGQADLVPVLEVPAHLPNYPLVTWSSSPVFGNITTPFQFTETSSVDNLTSYFWNFNDANTSTVKSPSHVFPCAQEYCTYEIDHGVTDSGGTGWAATTWVNRSAWITVFQNLTPTVTFTNTSATGQVSLTVTFNATPAGAIRVDSWYWTFGDGGTSTSRNATYTYTTAGHYNVTLTATNYTLGVTTVTRSNLVTAFPNPSWYHCSWGYRKNITIDHNRVAADLVNFPVLINLASDADLSANARADGFDILFTSSTGTTKIPHEIENFTKSSGALVAWVNVSALSSTTDTVLYLYYGNPSSGDQQSRTSVWDSNYKAVWHLGELVTDEATTGSHLDSTSNANTALQRKNGPIGGKIG